MVPGILESAVLFKEKGTRSLGQEVGRLPSSVPEGRMGNGGADGRTPCLPSTSSPPPAFQSEYPVLSAREQTADGHISGQVGACCLLLASL
jgi:hypothetical protein